MLFTDISFIAIKFSKYFYVFNRNGDESDVERATCSDDNELSTGTYSNIYQQNRFT